MFPGTANLSPSCPRVLLRGRPHSGILSLCCTFLMNCNDAYRIRGMVEMRHNRRAVRGEAVAGRVPAFVKHVFHPVANIMFELENCSATLFPGVRCGSRWRL